MALANARRPTTAPVIIENHVVALLAAADPLADGRATRSPSYQLADALGDRIRALRPVTVVTRIERCEASREIADQALAHTTM